MKVLSEKSVMLTLENGTDKSNSRSNQHFFVQDVGGGGVRTTREGIRTPRTRITETNRPTTVTADPSSRTTKKDRGQKTATRKIRVSRYSISLTNTIITSLREKQHYMSMNGEKLQVTNGYLGRFVVIRLNSTKFQSKSMFLPL